MNTLLILKTGSTFAPTADEQGDFEDWVRAGLGASPFPIQVIDARTEQLPALTKLAGVVITGSHSMVSDKEAWSEDAASWLRDGVHAGLPVLGICYGHQLLAHCLGAEVGYHPDGIEIGSVSCELLPEASTDALFSGLPPVFPAQVVHRQTVRSLPRGAVRLASSAHEPNQAFRVGASAWGVQFHPEFSSKAMHSYVEQLGSGLDTLGLDPVKVASQIVDTPDAALLLPAFVRHVARAREAG